MKDSLSHFLIDELDLNPSMHEIKLNLSDEQFFNQVYSDICVYNFENFKEKNIIENKIKKRFNLSNYESINRISLRNEIQVNFNFGEKIKQLNIYTVSKILTFPDSIQINRASFPQCVLN